MNLREEPLVFRRERGRGDTRRNIKIVFGVAAAAAGSHLATKGRSVEAYRTDLELREQVLCVQAPQSSRARALDLIRHLHLNAA